MEAVGELPQLLECRSEFFVGLGQALASFSGVVVELEPGQARCDGQCDQALLGAGLRPLRR